MPPARIVLWVCSLGVVALTVRSAFIAPVPLWVAGVVGSAYLALVLCGCLIMRWEMFADVVWVADTREPVIALTFDDGPSPRSTPAILEALEAAGVRAAFFLIGEKAAAHPELVRRIASAGHEIGVHGYRHEWGYAFKRPGKVTDDIQRCQDIIESATGVRPRFFRPPIGVVSPRIAVGAQRARVTLVGWTVRSRDGVQRANPKNVKERVMRGLAPGAIVLLHDAAERENRTPVAVELLPALLEEISGRGFRVELLSQLLERDA